MKTISYAAAGLLALSLLAGCSRSEPDEAPPAENAVSDEALPAPEETRAPEPEPAPEPAPVATANTVAPPPAAEIAPDEQMLDDADATGMTARATRDAPVTDAPPANETEDK
jgi:predicted small lipoprotein YifL